MRTELHLIGRVLKHAQKEWEINLPRANPIDSVSVPLQLKGRERRMRGFVSSARAQRLLSLHGQVHNLIRVDKHLLWADNYRVLRAGHSRPGKR